MFDTICTLTLSSDLFAQAIHPSLPILSVGLSAGHVQTYRLPPAAEVPEAEDYDESPTKTRRLSSAASENGLGEIETAWRTRRHKGSCRYVTFSPDGAILYSAGTDGLLKAAYTETGQVCAKNAIPEEDGKPDSPTLLHVLTPSTLLIATDSSALHIYDLRTPSMLPARPVQTHHPHDDFVSSITPLPASESSASGFPKQWISTGGTTLSITDLRRGVLVKSEDQEEELTSSLFVSGLSKKGTSKGEKVLVGGAGGVITLWEKGAWDDQGERIMVAPSMVGVESMEEVPEGMISPGKVIAAGLENGRIRILQLGRNKVLEEADLKHDDVEGVLALGFDTAGRMVSGGGQVVKVWCEAKGEPGGGRNGTGKGGVMENGWSDDEGDEEDSTEEEEKRERTKRRKRKRGKGKDRSVGHQVMAFKGID